VRERTMRTPRRRTRTTFAGPTLTRRLFAGIRHEVSVGVTPLVTLALHPEEQGAHGSRKVVVVTSLPCRRVADGFAKLNPAVSTSGA